MKCGKRLGYGEQRGGVVARGIGVSMNGWDSVSRIMAYEARGVTLTRGSDNLISGSTAIRIGPLAPSLKQDGFCEK